MKNILSLVLGLFLCALLSSCREEGSSQNDSTVVPAEVTEDKIVFSFAFTGCNRVGWGVHHRDNPSMANHVSLDSIFSDMQNQDPKPSLFFNLGDIVRAEQTDVNVLDRELKAWVADPKVIDFVKKSGIEMVAVPGNHELLQSVDDGNEYPLYGATDVWLKYMSPFMPVGRETAPDTLNLDNRSSFSFVRDSIAFIVLNTDTYNPPVPGKSYGKEGQYPEAWAIEKIKAFSTDKAIKQIYALGHRPHFVKGSVPLDNHSGLPNSDKFWSVMDTLGVVAYLAAHQHDYQRFQPNNNGTTQIIAGNAGSKLNEDVSHGFYGYSLINIYASGKTELKSRGYCVPSNYLDPPSGSMEEQDNSILSAAADSNPLNYPYQVKCKDL